jgi:hypothetical protein
MLTIHTLALFVIMAYLVWQVDAIILDEHTAILVDTKVLVGT